MNKGVGLDCGTMNLVSARKDESMRFATRKIRDAYVSLSKEAKRTLKIGKIPFVEREEDIIIVGDAALEISSTFDTPLRRPLSAGLISAGDRDSLDVLQILIKEVLGEPKEPKEICYFSVPANPIDSSRDIVYHTGVLERIIANCGYEPYPSNEAMAIIYSETEEHNFSGIALSFGSGMTNIAIAVNALSRLECSVTYGGDYIDQSISKALNIPQAVVCSRKEAGVDLLNPKNDLEEALSLYYKNLILEVLRRTAQEFQKQFPRPLTTPLPVIISGGTSLATGFLDLFKATFSKHQKKLPFVVSEIKQAKQPLKAVAYGLLTQAIQEYADAT